MNPSRIYRQIERNLPVSLIAAAAWLAAAAGEGMKGLMK